MRSSVLQTDDEQTSVPQVQFSVADDVDSVSPEEPGGLREEVSGSRRGSMNSMNSSIASVGRPQAGGEGQAPPTLAVSTTFELTECWQTKTTKASMKKLKDAVASALLDGNGTESDEESASETESESSSNASEPGCIERCARRVRGRMMRHMISPNAPFRSCWDSFACMLVLYECVMIPLSLFDLGTSLVLDFIGWIVRLFWTLDFPLSFFTGYMLPGDVVELRPEKVIPHYARTWMSLDVSMLCVDWAEVAIGGVGSLNAARMGKTIKSIRMIRMMRLWRLLNVNQLPESVRVLFHYYFQSEVSRIVLGICKIFIFLVWVNHADHKLQTPTLRKMSLTVQVGLLSGRTATVQANLEEAVGTLKRRAETALEVGKGQLVHSSGGVLDVLAPIKHARLQDGDSLVLNISRVQLQATLGAFAAVLGDRSCVTWGDAGYGGDSSSVQDQLKNVQQIQASDCAFAAILADGSVVTWGAAGDGADSSAVQSQLKNVQQIQATESAFAAILDDGSVVTWGHSARGGDSSAVQNQLKNVQQIQASDSAFAAILADGSVVTWGFGGDSSDVKDQLKNVQQIQATSSAFAAILADGSVVTWGGADSGGDSSAVQDQLKNVQQVQATRRAFAASLSDGSVVTWGAAAYGGDSSSVQGRLRNVLQVMLTGRDSSAAQDQLQTVQQIQVLACAWYGVGDLSLQEGSWLQQPRFQDLEIFPLYMLSYHWYERTYSVCALLLCFILSASIVSSITTSMMRLSIARSKETTKLAALKEYLKENHISSRTALRVQRNAQHAMDEMKRKHAPLGTVEQESPTFARQMCFKACRGLSLSRADVLFVSGVETNQMYFFTSGKLNYFQDIGNREEFYGNFSERRTVSAGDWACEASLWTAWHHRGTLQSRTQCSVLTLDAGQFQSLATQFKEKSAPPPKPSLSPRPAPPQTLPLPSPGSDALPFLHEYAKRFLKVLNVKAKEELTDLYDPEYDISIVARESREAAEEARNSQSSASLTRGSSHGNHFSAVPSVSRRNQQHDKFWLTGIFGRRRDDKSAARDSIAADGVMKIGSNNSCSTDVYPSNVYERTYSVCALLLCFILSASIVSSITTSMMRLSIARSKVWVIAMSIVAESNPCTVGYAACPARPDLLEMSDLMITFYPTVGEAICAHFRGNVRKLPGEARNYLGAYG
ncbi:Potassium channel KAT2 [Symbiodinium microadriaticum]|uniref:Potassium channel KAT2 n=1 Tax=Symbiodinium microadriaticum TaxID=2951 RepID=A0A1Q9E354_SYMMI|nr:Potassium channel KAT2 [Symbiodinium microadriaticum]